MVSNSKKLSFFSDFVVPFLVVFFLFCVLRHDLFTATHLVAVNDFAANDLLVVDAKSFSLLHGNYSRVGFYHPGPFFFQLMALSEIVLHDLLGVIPTAIGASVLAGIILNAAAIASLYGTLYRFFKRRWLAFLAVLITLAVVSLVIDTRQYYNGQLFFLTTWPPFLYIAAALFLNAGLVALACRAGYGMPLTAAGLMMLVHGHASFIGLAPVIALSILLYFAIEAGIEGGSPVSVVGRRFLFAERRQILVTLTVILLFCAPIALNTLLHWPGEIPKYFVFASMREQRAFSDVTRYWTTFTHWSLLAIPAAVVAAWRARQTRGTRLMYLILVATIPAVAFYTFNGLDTLDYKYPLFWAAPTLGLATAIAAIELVNSSRSNIVRWGCGVVGMLLVVHAFSLYSRIGVDEHLPAVEFETSVKAIRTMTSTAHPVPVEIDNTQIVPVVYAITLASVDKRLGGQGFCIVSSSWNTSYSELYQCPADSKPVLRLQLDDGKGSNLFKIGPMTGRIR